MKRKTDGMTLVEVMLAVAILSAGLVALLAAASRCVAVFRAAELYQQARWTRDMGEVDYPLFATDKAEELEVEPHEYANGFTFSRTVEETEDSEQDGLFLVRTRVSWGKGEGERAEETVRYILQLGGK